MKQIIIAIIFIGAAGGIFFGWSVPITENIKNLSKDIKDLEGVLSRFYDLRKFKNELMGVYNSISARDYNRILEIVPLAAGEGNLVVEFGNLAKENNLLLKKIDVKYAVESEKKAVVIKEKLPYETASISLSLDGSYNSLKSFLSKLENSLRIIDIKTLSFNAGANDSYEFNISAQAYFQARE
ncbi:MAG: type 4a pilus biogenesis protein PilO [Candidatus Niyogibacteria bacterium]|nr:type 4a pilus biogenesis protein PilO [Candidatus Niyogibacteria bacterium]